MPHIHFIGIGGAGIGPLAQVALQAGYSVSGSDLKNSDYVDYLKSHGIDNIVIGESEPNLRRVHSINPVNWVVYSSALTANDPNPPALIVAKELGIKTSKRDEFINQIITEHNLKLIAIAGTHGKTTTTAMTVWLFKSLNIAVSYIIPAKVSFGEMGQFDPTSKYFVYEADEYDRNFLSFKPELSLITEISWDHHEIFKTKEEYSQAFKQFISQSKRTIIWQDDADPLAINLAAAVVLDKSAPELNNIKLNGLYNRQDALLAVTSVGTIAQSGVEELIGHINNFPGLSRRMEEIIPNLYSDYAHTPEKIIAALDVVKDIVQTTGQKIIVIYEPLTNRRQTYIKNDYKDCFKDVDKIYWLDSYLAREDPDVPIIKPEELIRNLNNPSIAEPARKDENLITAINDHLTNGEIVIGLAGGGGGSLDDWLRMNFSK